MKKLITSILCIAAACSLQAQNRSANPLPLNSSVPATVAVNKASSFVCDTLFNFNLTDTFVTYTVTGGGYVSGQNSYGDLAKADYVNGAFGSTVTNVIIQFAVSTYGTATDNFSVKIWDANGASGAPGTELGTVNVDYATVEADIIAGMPSYITFPAAVTLNGPFYIGYEFGYGAGDTIVAYTNIDGNINPGTAWEKWSDNTWYNYNDASSWGLNVAHAILTEVCTVSGIQEASSANGVIVSPNPSNGVIKVAIANKINNASIEVYNALGTLVYKSSNVSPFNTITLDQVETGMYMVKVKSDGKEYSKRIMISK
jgi:hypothetical protein